MVTWWISELTFLLGNSIGGSSIDMVFSVFLYIGMEKVGAGDRGTLSGTCYVPSVYILKVYITVEEEVKYTIL